MQCIMLLTASTELEMELLTSTTTAEWESLSAWELLPTLLEELESTAMMSEWILVLVGGRIIWIVSIVIPLP